MLFRSRLSKRHGATAVGDYALQGILPEAMLNFLTLLGWNPGDEREFMRAEELVEAFAVERILKASSVFDTEKLEWLNGKHLMARPTGELLDEIRSRLEASGPEDLSCLDDAEWVDHLMAVIKVRARTLDDLAEQARPFVARDVVYEEAAVAKHWLKDPDAAAERLERLSEAFQGVEWSHEGLESALRGLASQMEMGAGKLIHPLRVALTGNMASPGIFDVLVLLGRERSGGRIQIGRAHV